MREHILILEAHLGRYLSGDETVHHINGDKGDNRLENLQLMTVWGHKSFHSRQERKRIDVVKAANLLSEGVLKEELAEALGVTHKTLNRKLREAGLYQPLPKGGERSHRRRQSKI